jgi:hypothetical protein
MVNETELLESWWASLTDEQRDGALAADPDDPPGWAVAALVACFADAAEDQTESQAAATRAATLLAEFLAQRR